MKNTLTRLQAQRRWDEIEKAIFYFFCGNIATALIYYVAIHSNYVEIIYK